MKFIYLPSINFKFFIAIVKSEYRSFIFNFDVRGEGVIFKLNN